MVLKRTIKVRCGVVTGDNCEEVEYRNYTVEAEDEVSVLNLLDHIHQTMDRDLSYYSFCRQGLCGGCSVEMNGKRVLACKTLASEELEIKPILKSIQDKGTGRETG